MKKALIASLAAASLSAHAQQEVTRDGLFADWYPADGETAVLVVHGTLAHKRMEIIETLSSLLNEDYDMPVLAPNLRLNQADRPGMIDCGLPHGHTHSEAVGEIAGWVDWLAAKGYEQVAIMGHSRGGAQVAAYLLEPSDVVVAAGLVAPATYDADTAAQSYKAATGSDLSELLASARSMAPSDQMQVPRFVYCEDATVTAEAFLGYHEPSDLYDTPTLLTNIQTPVQIIMGSEDTVVADLPDRLNDVQARGEFSVVTVDGADHFFRDLYADDVVTEFTDFLDR